MNDSAPTAERKAYVLDSNVLLYDPNALFKFEEHEVVIPITVIEEVDRFKKDLTETGRNARQFSRYLDELRTQVEPDGDLAQGVTLSEGGGRLRIDLCEAGQVDWPWADERHLADNLILSVARSLNERAKVPGRVILVTKDTNLRIKANALKIHAEDYEHGKVKVEELYDGQEEISVDPEVIDNLYRNGVANLEGDFTPNECLVLRNQDRANQTALARACREPGAVQLVRRVKEGVWGIFPRNKEQCFALDLLLDDEVKLVTLVGKAGTGKTLLAIAAGLHKAADERAYHRLLVSRPIFPLGKDIGFLPGDVEDKLNPWMKPVYDNVEFILDSHRANRAGTNRGHHDTAGLFASIHHRSLPSVTSNTYRPLVSSSSTVTTPRYSAMAKPGHASQSVAERRNASQTQDTRRKASQSTADTS